MPSNGCCSRAVLLFGILLLRLELLVACLMDSLDSRFGSTVRNWRDRRENGISFFSVRSLVNAALPLCGGREVPASRIYRLVEGLPYKELVSRRGRRREFDARSLCRVALEFDPDASVVFEEELGADGTMEDLMEALNEMILDPDRSDGVAGRLNQEEPEKEPLDAVERLQLRDDEKTALIAKLQDELTHALGRVAYFVMPRSPSDSRKCRMLDLSCRIVECAEFRVP
jgi:hypothetical protein